MRIISIILSLFLIAGCDKGHNPNDKVLITDEIRKNAALKINKETGLIPIGTSGQMINQIQMIGLSFLYHQPVDIVEGRKLVVQAGEILLHEINLSESVRPYLQRYPVDARNILIYVFVQKPDGSVFGKDRLCVVSTNEGMVQYETHDPNSPLLLTVYKESFEDAVQKMNSSKSQDKAN